MVVRQESRPGTGAVTSPPEFRAAVDGMRSARLRPEILCEEMPAPQRIAPYAAAMSADVTVDDLDLGTGRLILLHDPAGNDVWQGTFRCVAYIRAEVEGEMASDVLVGEATWQQLEEVLESHGATHTAASGSVTRVTTESFGGMADEENSAQVEIRASWTPLPAPGSPDDVPDIATHVEAWAELLCATAGLEPVPEGVTAIPSRRGQRGTQR